MSHELTIRKNQKAEMAYVGDVPWHGLGQRLEEGADIETWKTAAGMDWRVCRSRVRYGDGANQQIYDGAHVLFRSDDKSPLGIVSPKYKVVQPGEVLEFFRDLTDGNGYKLHTAGTMFGGKRFWALAAIGEEATVVGEDRVGGFLLLSSSADGSLATSARFTTVRVVCNNTLSMALGDGKSNEVVVRHASAFDPEGVKNRLGLARGQFKEFMDAARVLAAKRITASDAGQFVGELLVDTKTVLGQVKDVSESRQYQRIMDLFKTDALGGTLLSAEGTKWGLVNAVTQFVDHDARAATADSRMASAWFGRGDALKTAAFAKALA